MSLREFLRNFWHNAFPDSAPLFSRDRSETVKLEAHSAVRLSKLSEQNAGYLPTGYWLLGYLAAQVKVGDTIAVNRIARSGREPKEPPFCRIDGFFESSPVKRLLPQENGSVIAVTENSHWHISAVEPDAIQHIASI